jgi:mRNA interferase MazF
MKRGTVVLTPFPFTDLSTSKVRPAVLVSSDVRKGDDIILAFISSAININELTETELLIENSNPSFIETGLKTNSVLKLEKLATIDKKIVLGELGKFDNNLLREVNKKLKLVFDI